MTSEDYGRALAPAWARTCSAEDAAESTHPNMSTLALELDTPYVPPTVSREDELPDQCEVATHS